MPLTQGSRLGPYEVVSPLGAGGMGEVYRARDTRLDRDVAIKVLPAGLLSDEASRSRFRKEAKALSRLSHPHVATLLDFGSADGSDYLVMELIAGPTLDKKLKKGPLPSKDVVRLGAQLARGLKAAHDEGVIHRDLKPSNLCLTGDGLLKILDFGLARVMRPASASGNTDTDTALGKVVGSPPYMPPEQVLGKQVDARTDIYSAGAVLYELATGRRPFGERTGAALTDAILHEAPESPRSVNAAVSPGLEAVIVKALDKDPSLRYQTTGELLVDLERLQQGSEAGASGTRGEPSGAGPGVAVQRCEAMERSRRLRHIAAAGRYGLAVAAKPDATDHGRSTAHREPQRAIAGPYRGIRSWATDGDRVYYLSLKADSGSMALYSAPAGGGDSAEIPLPFDWERGIIGYLPKESALLMRGSDRPVNDSIEGGAPLWIVSVPAGGARRLSNLVASWAADLARRIEDRAPSLGQARRSPHRRVRRARPAHASGAVALGGWLRSVGPLTATDCVSWTLARPARRQGLGSGRSRLRAGRREPCGQGRAARGRRTAATSCSPSGTRVIFGGTSHWCRKIPGRGGGRIPSA